MVGGDAVVGFKSAWGLQVGGLVVVQGAAAACSVVLCLSAGTLWATLGFPMPFNGPIAAGWSSASCTNVQAAQVIADKPSN